jgi:hypothetical protein
MLSGIEPSLIASHVIATAILCFATQACVDWTSRARLQAGLAVVSLQLGYLHALARTAIFASKRRAES